MNSHAENDILRKTLEEAAQDHEENARLWAEVIGSASHVEQAQARARYHRERAEFLRGALARSSPTSGTPKRNRPRMTPAELDAAYREAAADPVYMEEMRQLAAEFDGPVPRAQKAHEERNARALRALYAAACDGDTLLAWCVKPSEMSFDEWVEAAALGEAARDCGG